MALKKVRPHRMQRRQKLSQRFTTPATRQRKPVLSPGMSERTRGGRQRSGEHQQRSRRRCAVMPLQPCGMQPAYRTQRTHPTKRNAIREQAEHVRTQETTRKAQPEPPRASRPQEEPGYATPGERHAKTRYSPIHVRCPTTSRRVIPMSVRAA